MSNSVIQSYERAQSVVHAAADVVWFWFCRVFDLRTRRVIFCTDRCLKELNLTRQHAGILKHGCRCRTCCYYRHS